MLGADRLEVVGLSTAVGDGGVGQRPILNDVSLTVEPGEIHGLVGESGAGKTMLALAVLRLLPPGVKATAGSILFGGVDLGALAEGEMRSIRGRRIAMIFQSPQASLNPIYPVGRQLEMVLGIHRRVRGRDARREAQELFAHVGLDGERHSYASYPHQLSGGMCQRVMIAMALANHPAVLLADEPTSALDVTTQRQILDLLRKLRNDHGMAVVLIGHDLAIVSEICDRVTVLRHGRVEETGPVRTVFSRPGSDYTRALLEATPVLERSDRSPVDRARGSGV